MYYSRADSQAAIAALVERLQQELDQRKKVLWLTSGGSNIHATVNIIAALSSDQTSRLTLGLVDERYGNIGHPDSNWQALLDAGLDTKNATVMPVLLKGHDRQTTARHYELSLQAALEQSDVTIGLLGMGEDGHTAGILPHSEACADTKSLVVDYTSSPYERITLSFAGLMRLDVVYVFAFGANKVAQLTQLHTQNLSLEEQPIQIIKRINEAYVYNEGIQE